MSVTERFRALHASGFFLLPNPWDVASARRLEQLGFDALATTSSAHAATLGGADHSLSFDALLRHVEALTAAVDVPVTVDGERLFAATPEGVAANVAALASVGAAGVSIEDHDPVADRTDPIEVATERVAAAAGAAQDHGLVLTARADQHLHGWTDLDDTLTRLTAYRDAGADVVYAPGLRSPDGIRRVVEEVGRPVNVLLVPGGPSPDELVRLGVRRASTGGRLMADVYAGIDDVVARLRSG